MHPLPFSYHKAASLNDALKLVAEYGDDGKILSGGQSLLPVMKLRLANPAHLIDISGLRDLAGVTTDGDVTVVGALTTHAELVHANVPLFSEMAHNVGDMQVRNLGTIGGALAHSDPAADYPAGALALEVELEATGPNGTRTVPIADFFQGFMTTTLAADEIVTAVRIPKLPDGAGFSYQKVANPASGYASAGVAAIVATDAAGKVTFIRVAVTGAADAAYRATDVEEALLGQTLDEATVKAAVANVIEGRDLLDDVNASAAYRAKVVPNITRRAILTAAGK